MITFTARLHRPSGPEKKEHWLFLRVPQAESERLPSRSMVSVEGTFHGSSFQATLHPDGEGGHWMKVEPDLVQKAGVKPAQNVSVSMAVMAKEPEPTVPPDVQAMLDASEVATKTWNATTATARRDWIQWITSGKKAETRGIRIATASDMLAKGKKRPCCFDRSGMYSKSLSCPIADDSTD